VNDADTCGSDIELCEHTSIKCALFAVMQGIKSKFVEHSNFLSIAFKCNMWLCRYSEEVIVGPSQIRMEILE